MIVSLKNYQSIVKGDLEIKGLTGVIGVNNQGKTAIMRAMKDACLNTFGLEKVTLGAQSGSITLNDMVLERAKSTTLTYKDETMSKLDGKKTLKIIDNPDFVLIDNDKIINCLPQFQFQREPLFPFSLTPSQVYYLFSMLFDIETINKMMMKVKDSVKEIDNQIKYLKGQSDEISAQEHRHLQLQSNLPDRDRLSKIEFKARHLQRLEEIGQTLDKLTTRKSKLKLLSHNTWRIEPRLGILNYIKLCSKKQDIQLKRNVLPVAGPEKLKLSLLYSRKSDLTQRHKQVKRLEYLIMVAKRYMSDIQKSEIKSQIQEITGQLTLVKVCPTCQKPI